MLLMENFLQSTFQSNAIRRALLLVLVVEPVAEDTGQSHHNVVWRSTRSGWRWLEISTFSAKDFCGASSTWNGENCRSHEYNSREVSLQSICGLTLVRPSSHPWGWQRTQDINSLGDSFPPISSLPLRLEGSKRQNTPGPSSNGRYAP